jgi:hypothetical protein
MTSASFPLFCFDDDDTSSIASLPSVTCSPFSRRSAFEARDGGQLVLSSEAVERAYELAPRGRSVASMVVTGAGACVCGLRNGLLALCPASNAERQRNDFVWPEDATRLMIGNQILVSEQSEEIDRK